MAKPERLHHIFSSIARQYPENEAVVATKSCITYRQLDQMSNKIASTIHPGGPVVIYLPPGIPFICAMLGILKAGSAYVPVEDRKSVV